MNEIAPINQNGHYVFPSGSSPHEIKSSIPTATTDQISTALALLFVSLKSAEKSDDDSAMTLSAYTIAVQDYPEFAINEAIKAFIKGKVSGASKTFVPSTAELSNEIERQMWLRIRIKERDASDVDFSPPLTDGPKKMAELLRTFQKKMGDWDE